MADPILTNVGQLFATHPAQRVYVRQRWAESWTSQPYLWCHRFKKAAAPDVGVGLFEWKYGIGLQAGQTTFATYSPLSLLGWYVKVEVDQVDENGEEVDDLKWYGVIEDERREPDGALSKDETEVPSGRQTFTAYGLEVLLTKLPIRTSRISGGTGDDFTIGRGVAFNAGGGRVRTSTVRGNRSGSLEDRDDSLSIYLFANNLAEAEEWSGEHIVRHLLAHHAPRDLLGEQKLPFEINEASQIEALGTFAPTIETEGRTVKDLLDEVIDRRRLLSYYFDVNDEEKIQLTVFTFNETELELADGSILSANFNQRTLNFEAAVDIENAVLQQRAQAVADVVRVRGAYRTGTCTLHYGESTLDKAWDDADATAFSGGASGEAHYPSEEDEWIEREQLNQAARAREQFARVFTHFTIPPNWDGKVGEERNAVVPLLGADGEPALGEDLLPTSEVEPFWFSGLRFLRELPLLVGEDYSTEVEPISISPTEDAPETRQPFALIPVGDPTETNEVIWSNLDRHSEKGTFPGAEEDRVSASLRVFPEGLVFVLQPSGDVRWALAGSDFTPLSDTSDEHAKYDWRDLRCTVCLEWDSRVEVVYPEDTESTLDVARELVIDLGDTARLDWLTPSTVIDTDAAGQLITSSGGWVRDDRPRMRNMARLAYHWYGRPRTAFDLTFHQVSALFKVGDLITEVGSDDNSTPVRTPITSVEWDLDTGRTTLTTDFADLQFS